MFQPAACGSKRGFTLIEFVVATLILSVGVLGLLKMVALSVSTNASTRMRTNATIVADYAMGMERVKPFAQITSSNASSPALVTQAIAGRGFMNYSVTKKVTWLGGTSKSVRFTVSWHDKKTTYNHYLTTIVTNAQTN
jgi:type IV pilus assembly protein PilV